MAEAARKKEEDERAAAALAAEAEEQAAPQAEETGGPCQSKEHGPEDEIEEEEELLYAAAVDAQDDDQNCNSDHAEADGKHGFKQRRLNPASPKKKRAIPEVVSPGRNQRQRLLPSVGEGQGVHQRPAGTASSKPTDHSSSSNALAGAMPRHSTWEKCVEASSLGFSSENLTSDLLAVPSSASKEASKSKWKSEILKMKPWLMTLEKILSSDPSVRITDQQLKSALTQAKKVNSKVDKRVDYESEENNEKTLSKRASLLKNAMESAKDLRGLALASAKQGPIDTDKLKTQIEKVQQPFKEMNPNLHIAMPLHWVQAELQKKNKQTIRNNELSNPYESKHYDSEEYVL